VLEALEQLKGEMLEVMDQILVMVVLVQIPLFIL